MIVDIAADDFGIVGSVGTVAVFVGNGAVVVFEGCIAVDAVAVGSVDLTKDPPVAVSVGSVGIDSAHAANDPVAVAAATAGFDVANAVAFVAVFQTLPQLRTLLRCDFCSELYGINRIC